MIERRPLSENSTVRLGLVMAVGTLAAGAIWWASGVSTQLRHIAEMQLSDFQETKGNHDEIEKLKTQVEIFNASGSPQVKVIDQKVRDLEDRTKFMETKGSPAVTPRLDAIEKEAIRIREDYELSKARSSAK